MKERVVVEFDVEVTGSGQARARMADALRVGIPGIRTVKIHTARDHRYELRVSEQPSNDTLADWTEPY